MIRLNCLIQVFLLSFVTLDSVALGDLMLTVEQRTKIDVMRSSGGRAIDEGPVSTQVKFNGFYFKSKDGQHKGHVWVDGKLLKSSQPGSAVVLKELNETTKVVDLSIKQQGIDVPFKAGQKLVIDNGELLDAYQK